MSLEVPGAAAGGRRRVPEVGAGRGSVGVSGPGTGMGSLMTEGADLLSLQARGLGRKGRPGLRLWAVG